MFDLFALVVFGLGSGVVWGLIARVLCRKRGMFALGERAFWTSLCVGPFLLAFPVALTFVIVATIRDRDVGVPAAPYGGTSYGGGYAVPVNSLVLQCTSGPLAGQNYVIGGAPLTIGVDLSNAVCFPQGTPGVSRRHCVVHLQNNMVLLTDLSSRYGTYLSTGQRLRPQSPAVLGPGSVFWLGTPGCQFQIARA